jgi:phosphoribosylglycinamide formyltransferase-1
LKKLVFLASGGGSNLKFVDQCIRQGRLDGYRLTQVVVDRECGAADYARRVGVPLTVIAYRRETPEELTALLGRDVPDVVITNIHKILDRDTVARHAGRLVNLHYSLLPAFAGHIGEKPVRLALEAGCKVIGTTAHYVTEQVDAGPIIAQSALGVRADEPFEALMNRVFRSGCLTLLRSLRIIDGTFEADADDRDFGAPTGKPERIDEGFWRRLATV